jgi:hypothetical protein
MTKPLSAIVSLTKNALSKPIKPLLIGFSKIITDSSYRNYLFLRYFKPDTLLQPNNTTNLNRYPEIFAAARATLGDSKALRLLSFGCSTGEEVITLRKYFPDAQIVGCDINQHNLDICNEKVTDQNTRFIKSTPDKLSACGPFDAIFCMAVLVRNDAYNPKVTDISDLFPFKKYDKYINMLDAHLKPQGLQIIYYTNFRFRDASVYPGYTVVDFDTSFTTNNVIAPKFGTDNKLIAGPDYTDIIFQKKSV